MGPVPTRECPRTAGGGGGGLPSNPRQIPSKRYPSEAAEVRGYVARDRRTLPLGVRAAPQMKGPPTWGGGGGVLPCGTRHQGPAPPPPTSRHPGPQKLPLGRGAPTAGMGCVPVGDVPGHRRGQLPSSVWTRHGAMERGKSAVGTTDLGKGKGCSERKDRPPGR